MSHSSPEGHGHSALAVPHNPVQPEPRRSTHLSARPTRRENHQDGPEQETRPARMNRTTRTAHRPRAAHASPPSRESDPMPSPRFSLGDCRSPYRQSSKDWPTCAARYRSSGTGYHVPSWARTQ